MIGGKLDEGNVLGAVKIASSSNTFSPPSLENATNLRSKHLDSSVNAEPFPSSYHHPVINSVQVLRETQKFLKVSAGGLSELRLRHLKDCLSSQAHSNGHHGLVQRSSRDL